MPPDRARRGRKGKQAESIQRPRDSKAAILDQFRRSETNTR
jgi:hypothetical protein